MTPGKHSHDIKIAHTDINELETNRGVDHLQPQNNKSNTKLEKKSASDFVTANTVASSTAKGESDNIKSPSKMDRVSAWRRRQKSRKNNTAVTNEQLFNPKNKQKIHWLVQILLLLPFMIGLLIFGTLASPWNHVQKIEVLGNKLIPADQVIINSAIQPQMSIPHIKSAQQEIRENLVTSHSAIRSASIRTENWHDVILEIQEYRPIAYVKRADFYYLVLENKMIVDEPEANMKLGFPQLTGFDEDDRGEIIGELTKLPDEILKQISEITNIDGASTRIALKMNDGNIVTGLIPTIADRMQYYQSITEQLEGQTGLIDMEVGIYFTELTPGNNPFASEDERTAFQESVAAESPAETSTTEVQLSSTSASHSF